MCGKYGGSDEQGGGFDSITHTIITETKEIAAMLHALINSKKLNKTQPLTLFSTSPPGRLSSRRGGARSPGLIAPT
jgi:hypothetical protein